jgi:hypothetical protein
VVNFFEEAFQLQHDLDKFLTAFTLARRQKIRKPRKGNTRKTAL